MRQRGFSVIEIMIGLIIGSMVLLSTYSLLLYFQNSSRSQLGADAALENALTGMATIGHEILSAGVGFVGQNSLLCSNLNAFYNGAVIANNRLIAPVTIQDNGNNPASITILHANPVGTWVAANLTSNMASPDSTIAINAGATVNTGILGLLARPNSVGVPCTIVGITAAANNGTTLTLTHDTTSPYNPPNSNAAYNTPITYQATTDLFLTLGSISWLTYSVNNGVLSVTDNIAGTTTNIADNVVSIQAQYGVTNGVNPSIAQWVSATGAWANLTQTTIPQIRAIKLAVITRSQQKEKPTGGSVNCNTTTTAPTPWPGAAPIDLSGFANWQCYRYRVAKTVIPVKNIMWGGIS